MAYWLLKTEPNEFSIDDLAEKYPTAEPWTGIRNFEARNHLKNMAVGDEALCYHSSCANIGIVGQMIVAKAAYPTPRSLI